MKVYRIELMVLDFDDLGVQGILDTLEHTSYPNRCMSPSVMSMYEREIEEWNDDNPLNKSSTQNDEFRRIFGD